MNRDGASISLWQDTVSNFKPGNNQPVANKSFDVIIAGAGITGLTTGLLLQKAGKSVLVAEAKNIGFGTSSGTTAHLNTFLDTPYNEIQKKFGNDHAKNVAAIVKQALELIKQNVNEYNIDCGYSQLPAFLFSQNENQTEELENIFKAAKECNVDCEWTKELPVPLLHEKALMWSGQATFHPTRYLTGIAIAFENAGGTILENCRITAVEETKDHHIVKSGRGEFKTKHFIYATHIPPGVNLLHFRCAPYRSYAMAVQLEKKEHYPDSIIYDMYDPYHYYRTQEIDGELYFIAGGEDHKTGHEENTENCFRNLEAHVRKYFPVKEIINRWSSQYFEPADGIPYIGHLPGHPGTMYVATGYGGNGMVYSAVAALVLSDLISKGESEWEKLFDPNRVKMAGGFKNFTKEAADVVGHLIKKIIMPSEKLKELAGLAPGEAGVVKYDGRQIAIYKNEQGEIYALHSACTHIKCDVAWNNAEKTWDCPCHGSRFSYTGEMLTAPARKDLIPVDIG